MKNISRRSALGMFGAAALVPVTAAPPAHARPAAPAASWENVVEKTSFSSRTAFEAEWNYLYPWGDTHNGAAKMVSSQISLSGGILTLKATRLAQPAGTSPHDPKAPLWYRSGAVHAKELITVDDQFPAYSIEGEFRTQTGTGIWPAFWTTGTGDAWPPESDILEYVGDATNLFNTWNRDGSDPGTDPDVERTPISGHDPNAWHKYRIWIERDGSTGDVLIDYYFDDVWKATHRGVGWVGVPQRLIINLQMGSWASGIEPGGPGWAQQPGPSGDTYFRARNVWFGRTRNW
ncbi:family 16 glycosylhydrolase [Kribbella sp. NPDC023855]|uniref:glycoside hydrolase family 16 protein n=1 Tax=Kribbella sp. NPDC023855 TaxID=3154698 RepID=UPI0033E92DF8